MAFLRKIIIKTINCAASIIFVPLFLFASIILALIARKFSAKTSECARLVFGPSPIINNKYWSIAMKRAGFSAQTLMKDYSAVINKKDDYDEYVCDRFRFLPYRAKLILLFWESLFRFDVFVLSFRGWLIGETFLWYVEPFILKLAGKKTIIIPYGADVYVYKNIRSPALLHGLMMSYPMYSKEQQRLEKRVNKWTEYADCVMSAVMGADGVGRWDVLRMSALFIDIDQWKACQNYSVADGETGVVKIVHAPNHTGFKGTEFIVDAIEKLKSEGLEVELILLQKMQNDEVQSVLEKEADILVEQLIFTGHGLNGIEGMASGLPVVSNLEDDEYMDVFRRWSFLNECPIVSAGPETLIDQLRMLITKPELRKSLGQCSRAYVEKYHDYNACAYTFGHMLKYVFGETESIINITHPLLKENDSEKPLIIPPLNAANKIA